MNVLLSTTNKGKIQEIKLFTSIYFSSLRKDVPINWLSLDDIQGANSYSVVEESGKSFLENAWIKAKTWNMRLGFPVLAEDSGLLIDNLNGEPGLYSSRYAERHGLQFSGMHEINVHLLKRSALKSPNSKARYWCAFMYVDGDWQWGCEGIWRGRLSDVPKGKLGFGFDPIFMPENEVRVAGEMLPEEKCLISHRGQALSHFFAYWLLRRRNEQFSKHKGF